MALPCSRAHGYELEYSLNANIYLHCIYSTVAGAVRNNNKVSWSNILTADDVHMLAWLSVALESETEQFDSNCHLKKRRNEKSDVIAFCCTHVPVF